MVLQDRVDILQLPVLPTRVVEVVLELLLKRQVLVVQV
jgi:hypothetical protein